MDGEKKWRYLRKSWELWCHIADKYPFKTLLVLFIPIYVFEGSAHNFWVKMLVLFVIALMLSMILSMVLKKLFKISRGFEIKKVMDYRFPSAHTLIATTLCVTASLLDNILTIPLFSFLILTAYSRVYIGAHEPVDVIAGFLLGLPLGVSLVLVVGNLM